MEGRRSPGSGASAAPACASCGRPSAASGAGRGRSCSATSSSSRWRSWRVSSARDCACSCSSTGSRSGVGPAGTAGAGTSPSCCGSRSITSSRSAPTRRTSWRRGSAFPGSASRSCRTPSILCPSPRRPNAMVRRSCSWWHGWTARPGQERRSGDPGGGSIGAGGSGDPARDRRRRCPPSGARAPGEALGIERSVDFLGRVDDAALDAAYRRARVFALPSAKEGFGIVYLEAWQRGLPGHRGSRGRRARGGELRRGWASGEPRRSRRPDRGAACAPVRSCPCASLRRSRDAQGREPLSPPALRGPPERPAGRPVRFRSRREAGGDLSRTPGRGSRPGRPAPGRPGSRSRRGLRQAR